MTPRVPPPLVPLLKVLPVADPRRRLRIAIPASADAGRRSEIRQHRPACLFSRAIDRLSARAHRCGFQFGGSVTKHPHVPLATLPSASVACASHGVHALYPLQRVVRCLRDIDMPEKEMKPCTA